MEDIVRRVEDDRVSAIIQEWARERPTLDTTSLGIFGRVEHLQAAADTLLRPLFAEAGLGNGDFNALAALRRTGAPFELSPGDLAGAMLVTSGAVTKRVDRLLAQGLVTREPATQDARGRVVRLSPRGLDLVDRLIEQHLAAEARLLAGLSTSQVATLTELLATLCRNVNQSESRSQG